MINFWNCKHHEIMVKVSIDKNYDKKFRIKTAFCCNYKQAPKVGYVNLCRMKNINLNPVIGDCHYDLDKE